MKKFKNNSINLFYVPALILFALFVFFPLIRGVRISFAKWNGYSQTMTNVGLANYIRMFTDKKLLLSIKNTLIYGFCSTLIQNVLGLAYAVFLNRKLKGRIVLRTIIYMPAMVAALVMGYVMYFFVQYNKGAINDIVMLFGGEKIDFMADGKRAVWIMTLINSLQYVGCSMVMYMAGLQNIPQMYYEAAELDGVTPWQRFRHITLPLLEPAINSAVVTNLIGGLKLFDIINALTKGGPGNSTHSLSSMVSYQYLNKESAGYASAIGILSFVLILIIGNIAMNFFRKREVEM